jgi:hypothetical protein
VTMKGVESVILNGQRVYIVVKNDEKPRYVPWFVWKWMVRAVVSRQKMTTTPHENGRP